MTRWRVSVVWLIALLALPVSARGDGSAVVLREERAAFMVTLLAGPIPLRAGAVDFEVLVQSRATGSPVLDAAADLRLTGPGPGPVLEAVARPGLGGNQLFHGARLALPSSGTWRVDLRVRNSAGAEASLHTRLHLAPPQSPARRYWAWIAAAPIGVALLALHQSLVLAQIRGSSRPPSERSDRGPGEASTTPAE